MRCERHEIQFIVPFSPVALFALPPAVFLCAPCASGSVITACRASPVDGVRMAVTVETTTVRQDDASVVPALNFLNGTSVPVEDVMQRVAGGAAPEVYLDTVYLDDELRVSKLEDGSVFVYARA